MTRSEILALAKQYDSSINYLKFLEDGTIRAFADLENERIVYLFRVEDEKLILIEKA